MRTQTHLKQAVLTLTAWDALSYFLLDLILFKKKKNAGLSPAERTSGSTNGPQPTVYSEETHEMINFPEPPFFSIIIIMHESYCRVSQVNSCTIGRLQERMWRLTAKALIKTQRPWTRWQGTGRRLECCYQVNDFSIRVKPYLVRFH